MNYAHFVQGFSERLIGARVRKEMSQARLADAAGVSLRSLQYWESGERWPRESEFERLADALGVSVGFLLGQGSADYDLKRSEGLELKEDERALLDEYRRLDDDRRAMLGKMLHMMQPSSNAKDSLAEKEATRSVERRRKARKSPPPK